MLEAFVGPRPVGHIARHVDGNSRNCSLANLEWSTHSINQLDVKWHRKSQAIKVYPDDAKRLRAMFSSGLSIGEISRHYGLSHRTVSRVVHRVSHADVA